MQRTSDFRSKSLGPVSKIAIGVLLTRASASLAGAYVARCEMETESRENSQRLQEASQDLRFSAVCSAKRLPWWAKAEIGYCRQDFSVSHVACPESTEQLRMTGNTSLSRVKALQGRHRPRWQNSAIARHKSRNHWCNSSKRC